jgi:uncharacterized protein
VRFWDSSALVTLVLEQPRSAESLALARADGDMVVWWGSAIECASAIARLHRELILDDLAERTARALLAELRASWYEIQPGTAVRDQAMRLVRMHPLRAADALQLSAALEWSGSAADGVFITYDERLRDAASREGFSTP